MFARFLKSAAEGFIRPALSIHALSNASSITVKSVRIHKGTYTVLPITLIVVLSLMDRSIAVSTCAGKKDETCNDPLDYTVRITFGQSAGSGFILSEDGYIVTNSHVVSHTKYGNVHVMLSDGTKLPGKIHSIDAISDVALIKINPTADGKPFKTAKLGESRFIRAGESIIAVGAPFHLQNTISQGTVSAPLRHEYEVNMPTNYEAYIQTDVSTNPGSSGGPLLNEAGEVIGMHSRKHQGSWGLAIPIDRVKQVVEQLKENKKVTRPNYGMNLADQTRGRAGHSVVVVTKVITGSPVEACGIQKGDCIVAVNGKKVKRIKDVLDVLYENGFKLGTSLEFSIVREFEIDLIAARLITTSKPTLALHTISIPTKMK